MQFLQLLIAVITLPASVRVISATIQEGPGALPVFILDVTSGDNI